MGNRGQGWGGVHGKGRKLWTEVSGWLDMSGSKRKGEGIVGDGWQGSRWRGRDSVWRERVSGEKGEGVGCGDR